MEKQILSQDELNALLKSTDSDLNDTNDTNDNIDIQPELNAQQKDTLREIGNIGYGAAAVVLGQLVNKPVVLDSPTVYITNQQDIKEQHPIPYILAEIDYKKGLIGSNALVIKMLDAAVIANLMLGGNGLNPSMNLGPMELSALGEAMNQIVGSASTSLSSIFPKRIEIHPPQVKVVDFNNEEPLFKEFQTEEKVAVISFRLQIEGFANSEIMLVIPHSFAVEMVESAVIPSSTAPPLPPPPKKPETVSRPEVRVNQPVEPSRYQSPPLVASGDNIKYSQEVQQIMVQPAQFAPFGMVKSNKEPNNIGLILDVPLQVTVELGSTRMRIKEILDLGIGSIIELDKLAGDPVDIYVNDKLIAKGEVVVIDENFGIKITDIISPIERANTLQ